MICLLISNSNQHRAIKETLQEFKRTHQDNWTEHKQKFTEDQLVIMTDLLVSQNYYA